MKNVLLVAILALSCGAVVAEDRVIYDGLGMRLEQRTDEMTDKNSCVMFLENVGKTYIAIQSPEKFVIWPTEGGNELFANDGQHLIRVEDQPAVAMRDLGSRNGLVATSPKDSASVVSALVHGRKIRYRYTNWPSHDPVDTTVQVNNAGFVYAYAVKHCGWKDLGAPTTLQPATLSVYESKDNDGYASVSVQGNRDLQLMKGFDKYGGGCAFQLSPVGTFGMKRGIWINQHVSLSGREKIEIFDPSGKVIFSEAVPTSYNLRDVHGGNPWPQAQQASRLAWVNSPDGIIQIKGSPYEKRISLYGFRELYGWGQVHCGFPPIAQ